MSDIKADVRRFIIENFLFGQDDGLHDDSSFLEGGFIDSTGVMELVAHLEETYRIKIADDELVPENLDSIESIAVFVGKKNVS